jgi:hypothetical protein
MPGVFGSAYSIPDLMLLIQSQTRVILPNPAGADISLNFRPK